MTAEPLSRQRVTASVEVDVESVNVENILDRWSEQEVEDLLSSNSEALDELARDAFEKACRDFYVTVNRRELEAYLVERRNRAAA